jgi:hypothetical protein
MLEKILRNLGLTSAFLNLDLENHTGQCFLCKETACVYHLASEDIYYKCRNCGQSYLLTDALENTEFVSMPETYFTKYYKKLPPLLLFLEKYKLSKTECQARFPKHFCEKVDYLIYKLPSRFQCNKQDFRKLHSLAGEYIIPMYICPGFIGGFSSLLHEKYVTFFDQYNHVLVSGFKGSQLVTPRAEFIHYPDHELIIFNKKVSINKPILTSLFRHHKFSVAFFRQELAPDLKLFLIYTLTQPKPRVFKPLLASLSKEKYTYFKEYFELDNKNQSEENHTLIPLFDNVYTITDNEILENNQQIANFSVSLVKIVTYKELHSALIKFTINNQALLLAISLQELLKNDIVSIITDFIIKNPGIVTALPVVKQAKYKKIITNLLLTNLQYESISNNLPQNFLFSNLLIYNYDCYMPVNFSLGNDLPYYEEITLENQADGCLAIASMVADCILKKEQAILFLKEQDIPAWLKEYFLVGNDLISAYTKALELNLPLISIPDFQEVTKLISYLLVQCIKNKKSPDTLLEDTFPEQRLERINQYKSSFRLYEKKVFVNFVSSEKNSIYKNNNIIITNKENVKLLNDNSISATILPNVIVVRKN